MSSTPVGAVVIDGSVAIAISAREAGREPKANAELLRYSTAGYAFYAPDAIVAETLYILSGADAHHLGTLLALRSDNFEEGTI